MVPGQSTDGVALVGGPASQVEADVVAAPVFEGDDLAGLEDADEATRGEIRRALASGEFSGKLYETSWLTVVDAAWRPRRVALVGAGQRGGFSTERLRKLAAATCLAARQRRVSRLALLRRGLLDAVEAVQAAAEGLTLGESSPAQHKTVDPPPPPPALQIVDPEWLQPALQAAARRGRLLGECSNLARALANEPSNLLTPRVFAERIAAIAAGTRLSIEVLDERAIAALRMGLLLGVARGSHEPPRVIVMRHDPPGAPQRPVLGLVGKGITFDTGGISLKLADGMERMKDDMSGGAAVACAMRAIAIMDAPIRVVGVVPSAENMPGGGAIKPGDVLRSASGKTVEVVNTDAEGRLVLGDALWYVQQLGATHLVDVATLTGACVTALGKVTSGLFGMPDPWVEHVRQVALAAGDRAWPMPVFDDYAEALRSEVADLVNSGPRPAGAITAAMFLKEFTGGLPWVHMDIAGTAWLDEAKPYQPKGASGVAVRTLAQLPFTQSRWPV